MRHCVLDIDTSKLLSTNKSIPIVYACQYDDKTWSSGHSEPIPLGSNGEVFLILCETCKAQIMSSVMEPIIRSALIEAQRHEFYISKKEVHDAPKV